MAPCEADVCHRAREAAAHEKAAGAESLMREEELQAGTAKLQKQLDKVGRTADALTTETGSH